MKRTARKSRKEGENHAEPLLRAQNLYKSYGRHKVLQGVSFDVLPGTLVGIVGENGAGKSTLLRILAGDLRPNNGKVIRSGAMGYCPQNVILNDALSVNQHLDYFRAAYNIDNLQRASELIEELGYPQYRRVLVANLSGGTKQKLNLTLALMHEPNCCFWMNRIKASIGKLTSASGISSANCVNAAARYWSFRTYSLIKSALMICIVCATAKSGSRTRRRLLLYRQEV